MVSFPNCIELSCVYDICCDFTNESCRLENGCINIIGNLDISILALDCENMPTLIEKSAPCEMKIDTNCSDEDVVFHPYITISCVSYSLVSGNEIEVRAEIKVCGNLFQCCYYNVLSEINIDENNKKECEDNAVLRLYFATAGEKVWDIAKRFNTSVEAVMLENNLDCEKLTDAGMLLIPIIS